MTIDLNADLGESYGPYRMGNDEAMLDIVSSANIACGFHAGDPTVMARTVNLCMEKGVSIGAHPGFNDVEGFGRRRIQGIGAAELQAMLAYQIGALQGIAAAHGATVRHVKMHGALANMASEDLVLATTCIAGVQAVDAELVIVAMASTALERAGTELDAPIVREVYADRAYNDDGTLVARTIQGAIIEDAEEAADRVLSMVRDRQVVSLNGVTVAVEPESVCVHGDHPHSVRIAAAVRSRLEAAGIEISAFEVSPNPVDGVGWSGGVL